VWSFYHYAGHRNIRSAPPRLGAGFRPQENFRTAGTNQRLKRSSRRNKKVSDGRPALRYYLTPRIA
jgi:hypothetical protein